MTQQPAPLPAPLPQSPRITAEPTSRLGQLHALYADAKAEADAATEKIKAIVDGIKVELTTAAPGQSRVALSGPAGPPLTLTYSESSRVNTKRLRADYPDLVTLYLETSGSWRLAVAKGGE